MWAEARRQAGTGEGRVVLPSSGDLWSSTERDRGPVWVGSMGSTPQQRCTDVVGILKGHSTISDGSDDFTHHSEANTPCVRGGLESGENYQSDVTEVIMVWALDVKYNTHFKQTVFKDGGP